MVYPKQKNLVGNKDNISTDLLPRDVSIERTNSVAVYKFIKFLK